MLDPFVYKSDRLRVLFGRGTVARLGEEAGRHKMTRALVLCSQGRGELGESIAARLGARFVGVCNAARPGMPMAKTFRAPAPFVTPIGCRTATARTGCRS